VVRRHKLHQLPWHCRLEGAVAGGPLDPGRGPVLLDVDIADLVPRSSPGRPPQGSRRTTDGMVDKLVVTVSEYLDPATVMP